MLERMVEITLLFDYYGKLLTERQQQIIRLYYFYDLSLGEIAHELDISRQGVYDHLQRAEKILRGYEKQLNLVKKFEKFRKSIDCLCSDVRDIMPDGELRQKILEKIKDLKTNI